MNAPVKPYDLEAIRAEFPILASQVYGKPLVYLDNAASAQKPRAVIDAMVNTMQSGYANVHRGLHYMANVATEGFERARETVREFLNAESVDEIVFTKSATEAYNLVADSFGRMEIGEGDEIILSIMEHHSNIVPWHFLRERKGAVIKWAPVDDEGNFLVEEFEKLITGRRAPSISRSTCATSTLISMSSPATRSMGRPASAFSTASGNGSPRCHLIRAAAR